MEVCPQVQNKCCTIMDEIKIAKYWNSRAMTLIGNQIDTSAILMLRIMRLFYLVGSADPKDMALKYIENKEVKYPEEICNISIKSQTMAQVNKSRFTNFLDYALEEKMKQDQYTGLEFDDAEEKKIDLKPVILDQMRIRKWGFKIPNDQLQKFINYENNMPYYA